MLVSDNTCKTNIVIQPALVVSSVLMFIWDLTVDLRALVLSFLRAPTTPATPFSNSTAMIGKDEPLRSVKTDSLAPAALASDVVDMVACAEDLAAALAAVVDLEDVVDSDMVVAVEASMLAAAAVLAVLDLTPTPRPRLLTLSPTTRLPAPIEVKSSMFAT